MYILACAKLRTLNEQLIEKIRQECGELQLNQCIHNDRNEPSDDCVLISKERLLLKVLVIKN